MGYGQGNIIYGSPGFSFSNAPGAAGANNGLSISTLDPLKLVLGQDVGQAGAPATLLSSREIPTAGFNLYLSGTGMLGIGINPSYPLDVNLGSRVGFMLVKGEGLALDGSPCAISTYSRPGTIPFQSFSEGFQEYSFVTPLTGFYGYLGVQSWAYFYSPTPAVPANFAGKFTNYISAFSAGQIYDNAGTTLQTNVAYFSGLNVQNGTVTNGYDFYASELNSMNTTTNPPTMSNHYGFFMEACTKATNNYGVYVNGNQINFMNGRLGIGNNNPSAWLQIKAGTATAGQAPLKLTSGTNLTVAENGAFEYNGTNLFFTRAAATRESVLVGNSGAAAPATTAGVAIANFYGTAATNFLGDPNSWASVVIGGTTYKIPLYT